MSRHPSNNTSYQPYPPPVSPQTYIRQYEEDQAVMWNALGYRMNHTVPAPNQISRRSSLSPNVPRWEILPLEPYGSGRGQGTRRSVNFVRVCQQPFLLMDALHENCVDLQDAERSAPLGNVSSKLSIRIPFPGAAPYTRQITARRSTTHAEPVAMKVLARKIAEEMDKYIAREQQARTPLMYRNMPVRLDQLALCGLQNISDGSWQPLFMIWTLPDSRSPC